MPHAETNSPFKLVSAFLLFILTVAGFSQVDSPFLKCVAVDENGDATLTWVPSTDGFGTFVEYRIYADNGGGITQIGTESNITVSTYTDIGANADDGSVQYFVTSFSVSEAAPSDSLSSIFLTVNNPGDGTAVLQWSAMSDNPISGSNNWYHIYREYPLGTWNLLDSTQVTNEYYRDTIDICEDSIAYQIRLSNTSGCTSTSNIDGGIYKDLLPPDAPIINTVTVDTASGNVIIDWNSSYAEDAVGYIILEFIGGGWQPIDTVYGYGNTTYTNTGSFANFQSEAYGIAAFDSCQSGLPPKPNTSPMGSPHNTVFVTTQFAICEKEVTLNWNHYEGWGNGVFVYEIYSSLNGASDVLLTSVSGTSTSYVHEATNGDVTYCYTIKAIGVDGDSSLSNKTCRYLSQPPLPTHSYLQSATVISDNEIEIRYHSDELSPISLFTLERTEDLSEDYETIATETAGSNPIIFTDNNVDASSTSYYYRITLEDSCGRSAMNSNIGKTILLNVSENTTNMVNLLQWTAYEEWDGNLIRYNIYRSVNGVFDPDPVASVPGNIKYYEDDVDAFVSTQSDGEFCYYVEAVEASNSFGLAETSQSNIQCAFQNPLVYIPNAIMINGINDTWKPVMNLLDFSTYNVKIMGRLGHIVFESNNSNSSWDGTYKGTYVPSGMFIYQVSFYDGKGNFHVKKGHITVVR